MSSKNRTFKWSILSGTTVLALTLAACGGGSSSGDACASNSACVTNFSEAVYQNGLALAGGAVDLSSGTETDRRLGYVSDI